MFHRTTLIGFALALCHLCAVQEAVGQTAAPDGFSGFLSGGAVLTPDFEGSADYTVAPLVIGEVTAFGVTAELKGLELRLPVRAYRPLSFGPVVRYNPGRSDVANDRVDRMQDIDGAVELGGFVAYGLSDVLLDNDGLSLEVSALADVSGAHDGVTGGVSLSYSKPLTQRWRLGLDASADLADTAYMDRFFGVDARDSAASGLALYDAEAGFKSVGVGATLSYAFTPSWSAIGRVGYSRLVGDAADSPIVADEGSPDQVIFGIGIGRRF